jgi:hypothetical protein
MGVDGDNRKNKQSQLLLKENKEEGGPRRQKKTMGETEGKEGCWLLSLYDRLAQQNVLMIHDVEAEDECPRLVRHPILLLP